MSRSIQRLCGTTLASTVLLTLTAGCGAGPDSSVLKPARPEFTFTGPPLTAKDRTFHQAVYLDYPGSEVRVLDVTALTSPNVAFLGAVAVWPRDLRGENVGGGPKFPPPGIRGHHPVDQVIPRVETAFAPRGWDNPASVAIAFGFRLDGTDDGAGNGLRIVYEVDGERRVELHRIAIIACPPPEGCPRDGSSDESDFSEAVLRSHGLLPA